MKKINKLSIAVISIVIVISVLCSIGSSVYAEYESVPAGSETSATEDSFTGNYDPERETTFVMPTFVDEKEKESMIDDANEVVRQTKNVAQLIIEWYKDIIEKILAAMNRFTDWIATV